MTTPPKSPYETEMLELIQEQNRMLGHMGIILARLTWMVMVMFVIVISLLVLSLIL